MNLQEQLFRINEMMGTSNKIEIFQKLIDSSVNQLKETCETMNSEDNEYVSFEACDLIDSNFNIRLDEYEVKKDKLIFYVNISYNNMSYIDDESFCIELQDKLKSWVGENKVIVRDYTNRYSGDW